MRIAVMSYPTLFQTSGGLKMKVMRSVEALNRRGVDARLIDPVRERLADFDLVHLFAPYNGNHRIAEQAKSDGLPLLISTILTQPLSRRDARRARLLSRLAGRLTNWYVKTNFGEIGDALRLADQLVALGENEKRVIVDGYRVPPEKVTIVPNGIGAEFFRATPDAFLARWPLRRPFVLHVGMIGDVKNQLGLIRALKDTRLPIVLIGPAGESAQPYLSACLAEGGDRVHYLGELAHGELIASAYAAAAVVAVPSMYEGMPNAVLEALACDRPAVLTDRHAIDFRLPASVAREVPWHDGPAIRDAVLGFVDRPPAAGAARAVVDGMSWDGVAEQLERIYARLCMRGGVGGSR